MILEGLRADLAADADQAHLDAETVHLLERQRDRIAGPVKLFRHAFEHVFDGEFEVRRALLQLRADEVVHAEILGREADHGVDDTDVAGPGHAACRAVWNR